MKWACVGLCLKAAAFLVVLFSENNRSHCACNPRVKIVFARHASQRSTYVHLCMHVCKRGGHNHGRFLVSPWNLFYIKCFTTVSQGVSVEPIINTPYEIIEHGEAHAWHCTE